MCFGAVALLAHCLASDRPLVLEVDDQRYWFPDDAEIAAHGGDELRAHMTVDDWAIWAPVRHSPNAVRTDGRLDPVAPPSSAHWLGTDDRGRDVLARLIHGTRGSVLVAVGAAALSTVVGVLLALLAFAGRRTRMAVVGGCDAVSAVPALVLVVAAQGLLGAGGLGVVVLFVALPRAADAARLAVAAMERALASEFCTAAHALGASRLRVLVRHALPHALPQLAVAAALTAATAVLAEAALSFLGFGVPSPGASWGELLRQAHDNGLRWWLAMPPGVAIAGLAAALNALAQPRR
jgi:peptide/nickel transport system permease protein